MKTYSGSLRLFGLPGGVKEIFSFSKLDKVFEIFGDIEDAGLELKTFQEVPDKDDVYSKGHI